MALKDKKIKMLTNGKEKRDFLYAEDCCSGLEQILNNYNKIKSFKKSVDLTTGKYTSIIEIAKTIQKILKKEKIFIKIQSSKNSDSIQLDKRNKPDLFIKKYWKPKYSLQNGIERIIQYYYK